MIRDLKLFSVEWNPQSVIQRRMYCAVTVLLLMLVLWGAELTIPTDGNRSILTEKIKYPFEHSVYDIQASAHAVMFDTLFHGGVVQETPAEELLELDNPYDPTERNVKGVRYLFDYALYNGKYYSYFGMAPVIIFYAPYYYLTGYLPSYIISAAFFAGISVVFGMMCTWSVAKYFVEKTSALAVMMLGPMAVIGSGLLMIQSCADRYYLNILAGIAFFYLSVYAGLCAEKFKGWKRYSLYFLSTVGTFLAVWSRPLIALEIAAWLIPCFILTLVNSSYSKKEKIMSVLAYMIPVSLGALVIMMFNYIRFNNVFEFGQFYQLTIEETKYNKTTIRNIIPSLFYYFIDPLSIRPDFPWFMSRTNYINHSGNYFYGVVNSGVLSCPLTWGMIFAPASKVKRKWFLYIVFISTIGISIIEYSVAGVAQRYVSDILLSLCLIAFVILISLFGERNREGIINIIVIVLSYLTICVEICLVFNNYRMFISFYNPDKYIYFVRLFSLH